jgi:N-alpha-acetyltransferase 15/16, NatA auxiliary subunit
MVEFLSSINSSRTNEFRSKCDAKFELSTMFKTAAEQEVLKKMVMQSSIDVTEKEMLS